MRMLLKWGTTAALAVGLAAAAQLARADDTSSDDVKPPPKPFIQWNPAIVKMFNGDQDPPPKKTPDKPKKDTPKKKAPISKPVNQVAEGTAERAREEASLMRRLEVCDKLTEIAIRTNDTELLHRAEALEERARTTYAQRTAYLPRPKNGFESDEKALDQQLGASDFAPTASTNASAHSVSGTPSDGRAALKENNP